jgi:hypothetical protein
MSNLAESLFWEIFHRRETVRSELAHQFQLSAATVSRAVGVLLSKQLVVEMGAPAASRGRRPALLQLNPSLAYVGGIELDRNMITAVVTDLGGNLLGRGATAASSSNSVESTMRDCVRTLCIALRDADLPQTRLAQIDMGHTATLDVENGLCLDWENSPQWRRVPLADSLRAAFKTEIIRNVKIRVERPDERPALVLDDVARLELSGLDSSSVPQRQPVILFRNVAGALLFGNRLSSMAEVFLGVTGELTKDIALRGNDLRLARQEIRKASEVTAGAISTDSSH